MGWLRGKKENTEVTDEELEASAPRPKNTTASAEDISRHAANRRLAATAVQTARGGEGAVSRDIQQETTQRLRSSGVGLGLTGLGLNQGAFAGAGLRHEAALRGLAQEKEILTGAEEQRQVTWEALEQRMQDHIAQGTLTEAVINDMLTGDPWIDDKLRARARDAPGKPSLLKSGQNIYDWFTGEGRD